MWWPIEPIYWAPTRSKTWLHFWSGTFKNSSIVGSEPLSPVGASGSNDALALVFSARQKKLQGHFSFLQRHGTLEPSSTVAETTRQQPSAFCGAGSCALELGFNWTTKCFPREYWFTEGRWGPLVNFQPVRWRKNCWWMILMQIIILHSFNESLDELSDKLTYHLTAFLYD